MLYDYFRYINLNQTSFFIVRIVEVLMIKIKIKKQKQQRLEIK